MKVLGYMLVIIGVVVCKLTLPISMVQFSFGFFLILAGGALVTVDKNKKDEDH